MFVQTLASAAPEAVSFLCGKIPIWDFFESKNICELVPSSARDENRSRRAEHGLRQADGILRVPEAYSRTIARVTASYNSGLELVQTVMVNGSAFSSIAVMILEA